MGYDVLGPCTFSWPGSTPLSWEYQTRWRTTSNLQSFAIPLVSEIGLRSPANLPWILGRVSVSYPGDSYHWVLLLYPALSLCQWPSQYRTLKLEISETVNYGRTAAQYHIWLHTQPYRDLAGVQFPRPMTGSKISWPCRPALNTLAAHLSFLRHASSLI